MIFLKKHWKKFIALLAGIAGAFLFFTRKKQGSTVGDTLIELQDVQRKRDAEIDAIEKREQSDLEKNDERLESQLSEIAEAGTAEKLALEADKSKRTEELSKKSIDDLAGELASKRGWRVIE